MPTKRINRQSMNPFANRVTKRKKSGDLHLHHRLNPNGAPTNRLPVKLVKRIEAELSAQKKAEKYKQLGISEHYIDKLLTNLYTDQPYLEDPE